MSPGSHLSKACEPAIRFLHRHLLIAVTISFMAGIVTAFHWRPDDNLPLFVLLLTAMAATCLLCRTHHGKSMLMIVAVIFLTGTLLTDLRLRPPSSQDDISNLVREKTKATITGTILEMPEYDGKNSRIILKVDGFLPRESTAVGKSVFQKASGIIRLTCNGTLPENIVPGSTIMAIATLNRIRNYQTPGGFDYEMFMASRNIRITGWISSPLEIEPIRETSPSFTGQLLFFPERIRHQTASFITDKVTPEHAGVYQALLLGSRALIPPETIEQYKNSGSLHLLAISGLHLSLLGLMSTWTISWILRRSHWCLLHFHVPTLASILSAVPLCCYVLIAGMNTPVLRAAVMATMVLIALMARRERLLLHILAAAVLILLTFNPLALFTVSFQLSFSAVLAISLITPSLMRRLDQADDELRPLGFIRHAFSKTRHTLHAAFLVSLAATIGTLPFLLYHFNRFSLIGPFANLLVEPFLCLWALPLGLSAIPCSFISPETGELLLKAGEWGIAVSGMIIAAADELPLASVWAIKPSVLEIVLYYLAVGWSAGILFRFRKGWGMALLVLLACWYTKGLWFHSNHGNTEISYLDVGQGTSTLIRLSRGHTILVDGGSYSPGSFDIGERVIAPFLWKKRIWKLDDIIVTHPDSDHFNGVSFIVRHFSPDRLHINNSETFSREYQTLLELAEKRGTRIIRPTADQIVVDTKESTLKCLGMTGLFRTASDRSDPGKDSNDSSLVFKLQQGTHSFLFPGDISIAAENILLSGGTDLKADVLLAPHHGSLSSSGKSFMDAVSPEIVVVSAGASKASHFPHPRHLEDWMMRGIRVLQTGRDGTISITSDGRRMTVGNYGDREIVKLR